MGIKRFKPKAKEIKRGFWNYVNEPLTEISVKKDDTAFKGTEIYKEIDCIKIGELIYDIESVDEEFIVTLTEPIKEDFTGMASYVKNFPIIIRRDSTLFDMMIDQEANLPKMQRKTAPLSRCTTEIKQYYMSALAEEKGEVNIDASAVMVTFVDELKDKQEMMKQSVLRELIQLALYIDMDYKIDDIDLWTLLGIQKGNYVKLVELLRSEELGILADKEDIDTLRYTIEAIKLGEDVNKFILIQRLREGRKLFESDEAFNEYIRKTFEQKLEEEKEPTKKPRKKKADMNEADKL